MFVSDPVGLLSLIIGPCAQAAWKELSSGLLDEASRLHPPLRKVYQVLPGPRMRLRGLDTLVII